MMSDAEVISGWLVGALLVLAMVPRQVRAIRMLCFAAGMIAFAALSKSAEMAIPLALVTAFVLVNMARIIELLRRAGGGAMSREERELFDHVMEIEDPGRQNRLRDLMVWRDVSTGERLISQGERDPPLIYIASGRAAIERDGRSISECGAGEFVGEMSHLTDERTSATVTVTQDMRIARLDRDALAQLVRDLPKIGRALDTAFNRSLAVKVMRMNEGRSDGLAGQPTTALANEVDPRGHAP